MNNYTYCLFRFLQYIILSLLQKLYQIYFNLLSYPLRYYNKNVKTQRIEYYNSKFKKIYIKEHNIQTNRMLKSLTLKYTGIAREYIRISMRISTVRNLDFQISIMYYLTYSQSFKRGVKSTFFQDYVQVSLVKSLI